MTYTYAPEVLQSTIVISNSRKDVLVAAMRGADETTKMSARMPWITKTYEPANDRLQARTDRILALIDSL